MLGVSYLSTGTPRWSAVLGRPRTSKSASASASPRASHASCPPRTRHAFTPRVDAETRSLRARATVAVRAAPSPSVSSDAYPSRLAGLNVALNENVSTSNAVLRATAQIKKNDVVLSVPEAAWLTKDAVLAQDAAASPAYAGVKDLDPWIFLSLSLMRKDSDAAALMMSSPDVNALQAPILWDAEELVLLQGTQIADSVNSYKQFYSQTYHSLVAEGAIDEREFPGGEQAFTAAACVVRGCSHEPVNGKTGSVPLSLVPGIERVGHARGVASNVSLDVQSGLFGGQKALVAKATRDIAAGEEICFDFSPGMTEGHVLLNHGTIDADAPGTFAITLVLSEEDKFFDDKIDILELNGLEAANEFILQRGAPPPETMLAVLRLINMEAGDAFLLESIFRNEVWGHVSLPISEENEGAVYESMVSGCTAVLQQYPTKIDDDLAILNGLTGSTEREKMAAALRLGEKEVLDSTLRFFEERMGQLKEFEYYGERRLKRLGLLDKDGKPTTWDDFMVCIELDGRARSVSSRRLAHSLRSSLLVTGRLHCVIEKSISFVSRAVPGTCKSLPVPSGRRLARSRPR